MRTGKSRLTALQVLGAIPLFFLVNPVSLVFALLTPRVLVPVLAYAVTCAALWAGSWAAFRGGRTSLALALSTPPALVLVAGVGFYVFAMLSVLNEDHDVMPEMAARGALATFMSAEFAYKFANHGVYGDPACLAGPAACIPGYTGPSFIAQSLRASESDGYRRTFHPGPSNTFGPKGSTSFAYTVTPLSPSAVRASFCGDDSGRVCRDSSGEPRVVAGRCDDPACYESSDDSMPFAAPVRPSLFDADQARSRPRAKVTRRAATERLTQLGYPEPSGDVLVKAAAKGDDEAIAACLAAGIPVDSVVTKQDISGSGRNSILEQGDTALYQATRAGYLDTAADLLKAGASPKIKRTTILEGEDHQTYGDTPLIELAKYCDEANLVRGMIKAGADVNAITRGSSTALRAAEKGHCVEIAGILREAGARR